MRPVRRPVVTRGRLVVVGCLAAAVALGGWPVVRYLIVPREIRRVLMGAGLEPATFRISSVGARGVRLSDVSIGTGPWLSAGSVVVSYSLAGLVGARMREIELRDVTWRVEVRDGSVVLGPALPGAGDPGKPVIDLPFDRLTVRQSVVRLVVNGETSDLPMEATLVRSVSDSKSADGRATSVRIADLQVGVPEPATLNLGSLGFTGRLRSMSGHVRASLGSAVAETLEGELALAGESLRAGDVSIPEFQLGAVARSASEVEVTTLRVVLGDGGTIVAAPFSFDPGAPVVRTRLALADLTLETWLPLLTEHHASGQGRVGGSVEVALDLTGGAPRLIGLSGALGADPTSGFIEVSDAAAVGTLLEAQDPRFATDEVMRPLRDKIVAALGDFAYNRLTVDLSRQEEHTAARAYISGFGRHGEDPQGLNITLDLRVHDALVDLASRMASLSKARAAARSALDRFFAAPDRASGERDR